MNNDIMMPGVEWSKPSRMAEEYLLNLFPDRLDWCRVLYELSESDVVEIGSGISHVDPYSLMSRVEQIRQASTHGSYRGYDAKLGKEGEITGFDWGQRAHSAARAACRRALETVSISEAPYSTLGSQNARYGSGHTLPGVANNSLDLVLSHWAFPSWTLRKHYERTVKKIYGVLRMDREARLYPVRDSEMEALLSDFVKDRFDVQIYNPLPAILTRILGRAHRTLVLTKQK